MPRFAANLSTLFTELPFLERFAAARSAGFVAVECQFPYAAPAHEVARALADCGLPLVLHNLPAGDWAGGERGMACHPGREAAFRDSLALALDYARTLGCPRLNCLVGRQPDGVPHDAAWATLVANLRHAAGVAAAQGVGLLIEPLNRFDVPGFFIHRTDQALALIDEVASPHLRLQYDLYHAQRSEGELAATLARHLPRIGHLQIADNPGRHEPGTGEIHYPYLFARIDALGWAGYVGCEWLPRDGTLAGLGAIAPWLGGAPDAPGQLPKG